MKPRAFVTALLIAALATPVAMAAPETAGIELSIKSFQEIEKTDAAGRKKKVTVPLVTAVPGSEVIYVLSWRNAGAKPATGVVLTDDLPKEVMFVPGSAKSKGAVDEVSVDGGKSWGQLDALTVKGDAAVPRPAVAGDVTDVHWKLSAPVAPGGTGSVSYRAKVR